MSDRLTTTDFADSEVEGDPTVAASVLNRSVRDMQHMSACAAGAGVAFTHALDLDR